MAEGGLSSEKRTAFIVVLFLGLIVLLHERFDGRLLKESDIGPTLKVLRIERDPDDGTQRRKLLEFLDVESMKQAVQKKLPSLDSSLAFLELNSTSPQHSTSVTTSSRSHPQRENHITFLDSITSHHESKRGKKPQISISSPVSAQSNDQNADAKEIEILHAHPPISPRKGTDISTANQMAILLCPNQSKCIVPELQLQRSMRIYFCKHPTRHGVRFYYLAREGLLLHPNVHLVSEDAIDSADYIVYLPGSAPWHLTECNKPSYAKKLIVLDEFDGHTLFSPASTREEYTAKYGGPTVAWYNTYFKRSFVRRSDGVFQGYPHIVHRNIYPMTYAIAEAYVPHTFNNHREIEILCTLRGSKHMSTRLRVQEWVAEYGKARSIKNIISSQVNTASRTTVSMQYFQQMFNSQIIVTVNPANWEGDFRLWESMCTGALIFVDPIFVPHQYPLIDGEHVIFFSNRNKTELFEKLDYYRSHPIEARKIAINGYLHAMKYHRTVNLIDYVLRTVHWGNVTMNRNHVGPIPKYTFTGQYLNYEAKMQQEMILNCHSPGIYEPLQNKSDYVKRLSCSQNSKNSHNVKFLN